MTEHVSMEDRYSYYQRSAKPEIQHMQPGDAQEYIFWDDVTTLTLRGRLSDVWELLQLHSEVRSVVEYTSTPEDRRGLVDLQEMFQSHPIRLLDDFLLAFRDILTRVESERKASSGSSIVDGFTAEDEATISTFMRTFSSDWMHWHALVTRVRRDPYHCPLFSRMPQLQAVLHMMTGDVSAIAPLCGKYVSDGAESSLCWQQFALCRLIYSGQSPPPFSKPVVIQLLEEALDFQAAENRNRGVDGGKIAIARLLQRVLAGQTTPVLKFMYELSMAPPNNEFEPTPLKTKGGSDSMSLVSMNEMNPRAICAAATEACTLMTASVCAHLVLILDRSEILPTKGTGVANPIFRIGIFAT